MIFLASPYSDPDPCVIEARYKEVCCIAGALMERGFVVFSPVAHCHPISIRSHLSSSPKYWGKFDAEFIGACEKVVVVMLPGWEHSLDVAGQIAIAQRLSKPVEYLKVPG